MFGFHNISAPSEERAPGSIAALDLSVRNPLPCDGTRFFAS